MLIIEHLSKKFGAKIAVDDVSFGIDPGEIFALIGPNGSGKTTIVKTVAGLLYPTAGRVSVGGHEIVREPVAAKSLLGYIPDEPAVWPAMTGDEFLSFTAALYGLEEKEWRERSDRLLAAFKLSGAGREYFEDYSRGHKQKFAIIAALLHRPKLLLIDEPIVGLDPISADTAKKMFLDFAADGGAILLVTHTLDVAAEIAGRFGFLRFGRLSAAGTLAELAAQAGRRGETGIYDIYRSLA